VKDLQNEPDVENLLPIVKAIYANFAADNAPRLISSIPRTIRMKMADALTMTRQFPDGRIIRHVYDEPMALAMSALEQRVLSDFISSSHYHYVLELKAKELQPVTVDYFKVVRMLGKGAFGQVLEVIKRDCGKRYAMKVMEKKQVASVFGDSWESLVLVEKNLQASLHHPLLINLAYAFQNIRYLILVMDCCHGGDLEDFGVNGREHLTAAQIRFVGLEVCAVVVHLHKQCVMYRDLKPQNLLLDDQGHIRLIDFGIAEQGDVANGVRPTSGVECGSGVYVAPEIKTCYDSGVRYGVQCDWFSFGVMLYELQEKEYPFGECPIAYRSMTDEYVQPVLLDDDGESEVPGMFDLLAGLLDWNPDQRFGHSAAAEDELMQHEYWLDMYGNPPDWELINKRLLPSPLLPIATERVGRWARKEAEEGGVDSIDKVSEELAKDLAHARDETDQALAAAEHNESNQSDKDLKLMETESEYNVEDWEFSSEHAIQSEYRENHEEVVSMF